MLPSSMAIVLFTDGKGDIKRNSVKICKHLKYFLCTMGNIEVHKNGFPPLWKQSFWLQKFRRIRNLFKFEWELVVKEGFLEEA